MASSKLTLGIDTEAVKGWLEKADMVYVVRCKDCTYGEDAKGVADGVVECKRLKMVTKDDWYCAEGRRKDEK